VNIRQEEELLPEKRLKYIARIAGVLEKNVDHRLFLIEHLADILQRRVNANTRLGLYQLIDVLTQVKNNLKDNQQSITTKKMSLLNTRRVMLYYDKYRSKKQ